VLVAAVLAAVTIVEHMPGLLGIAMAAFVAMLGGLLDLSTGWTGPGTAAIVLALVLAVTPLVPSAAFRLSDLPLPFIPLSADDLRKDEYVVPGPEVLRKTLVADRFVTGMAGGTAGLVAGCELLLSRQWFGAAPWLLAVAAAAVALRARLFTGRAQRVWLLSAAALGAALLAVNAAGADEQAVRLLAGVGPLLAAAVVLVVVALRLPGARPSPIWGRAGDIAESLLIVAVVPLALAVVGLYGYVRGLAG
jgi:type VII secretion integral membrane protein EccD